LQRITKITLPMALVLAALVVFLFVDMAQDLADLKNEKNRLAYELEIQSGLTRDLNESLANCSRYSRLITEESRDYYDKWQAERTIAYAIWQMFDAAVNVTMGETEWTQVNILVPRDQIDYLRNLSKAYGLNYE
jgi:exoribonuclease II